MTFRTLHDRVLVKQDKAPDMIGLIHVPDSAKEPPNVGEVIAANSDRDVVVGDRVMFIKNAGQKVKVGDDERLMMFEMDIYGVLENGHLRPISSKVLIKPDPPDEKEGRIVIPKAYQKERREREQLVSGRIVAIGPGMRTKKGTRWAMPDVQVGQRVLYYNNYTPDLMVGGEVHVVVSHEQLRAVIEEE